MSILRTGIDVAGAVPLSLMGGGPIGVPYHWWDPNNEGLCIWAAYKPLSAANFAASLVDLSGNGNDAVDPGGGNTPGWGAVTGWTFNGAQHLTTAFVPQNDQSQTMIIRYTNVTNTGMLAGVVVGADSFYIRPDVVGGAAVLRYQNGNAFTQVVPGLLAGRLGIAGNQGYRNGVADGAPLAGYGAAIGNPLYIGCWNNGGVPAVNIQAHIQLMAIYDCTLTPAQYAAVDVAVAAET